MSLSRTPSATLLPTSTSATSATPVIVTSSTNKKSIDTASIDYARDNCDGRQYSRWRNGTSGESNRYVNQYIAPGLRNEKQGYTAYQAHHAGAQYL